MKKIELVKKYSLPLKLVIAVGLIILLFGRKLLTIEDLKLIFSARYVETFLLSGLMFFFSQCFAAQRLRLLLRGIGYQYQYYRMLKITMIGAFFNIVIPGSVGGDVVKGYYLYQNEKDNPGKAVGVLVLDRVLGVASVVLMAGLFLCFSVTSLLRDNQNTDVLILSLIMVVICIVIGVLAVFFISNERMRNFGKRALEKLFGEQSFVYRSAAGFGGVALNTGLMIYSFIISIMIQALSLAGIYILICTFLPGFVNKMLLVAASAIVMLVGLVPVTPGNVGVVEFFAAVAYNAAGSGAGALVFVYWRIICIIFALPGGIMYLTQGLTGRPLKG